MLKDMRRPLTRLTQSNAETWAKNPDALLAEAEALIDPRN
jgi:hypothetical protein